MKSIHRFKKSTVALTAATLLCMPQARADVSDFKLEVYGFTQADYIQDFRRVDPDWDATLRPSKIPTTPGLFGSDGQAIISVRQSRLGVQGSAPVQDKSFYTRFEFDMFGVGDDAGQVTIRLRHAYGQWGEWLAGQTHSLFMDIDVFPNIIDYWGPAGIVFLRNPQIRWTPVSGLNNFAIAIELPTNDIDPGQIREVAPSLGQNIQGDEKLPDLTAQYRRNEEWGYIQLGGILRRIGYDTLTTPNNEPSGFAVGWGLDLTTNLKFGKDKLILAGVYGHGIASYMNDGGTDLAPGGAPGNLEAQAVPLFGLTAYYEHAWSDFWSSTLGYSQTQVQNTSFQEGPAFFRGQYASINLLYSPVKKFLVGAEALWGMRTDHNGNTGQDVRTQVSFKYNFSSNPG